MHAVLIWTMNTGSITDIGVEYYIYIYLAICCGTRDWSLRLAVAPL